MNKAERAALRAKQEQAVLDLLESRQGRTKAIKLEEIVKTLGLSRRSVFQAIEHLRRAGLPIGSSRDAEGGGYYRAEVTAEMADTIWYYRQQVDTMRAVLDGMYTAQASL